MKPLYFMLAVMCFLLVVACAPRVTVPKDWCVKYELRWSAEKNLPDMTLCVCTEDILVGLQAALNGLMSFPDNIEIGGVVLPKNCGPTARPAPVNDGDEAVKELLRN